MIVLRFLIIGTLLFPMLCFGQTEKLKIGEWKHHFAFNDCSDIVETPTQIIGAATLGLLIYNKLDESITTLTKLSGLSDYDISAIKYLNDQNTLVIGYANGNIDLIVNGTIFNINDLKLKQIDGGKGINNFLGVGNTIYCSTDFGIILLNIEKKEISSTWYIGDNAANTKVYQVVIDGDNFYAATDNGLRKAPMTGVNPAFYESWTTISPTNDTYNSIAWFNNQLIAAMGKKGQTCAIQSFKNNQVTGIVSIPSFNNFYNSTTELIAFSNTTVSIYNQTLQLIEVISSPTINGKVYSPAFRLGLKDQNNDLWISDNNKGLIKRSTGNSFDSYTTQGPASNSCNQLLMSGPNLWVVAGGLTNTWNNANINASSSVLTSTGWQHITSENTTALAGTRDLLGISANPLNPNNLFINSWGNGVFELENEGNNFIVKNHFKKSEDGLQNIDWAAPSGYVRIGATAFDQNNVLYMTNSSVESGLVAYFQEDQTFVRYNYQSIKETQGLGFMLMSTSGDKWMIIGRGDSKGLFVWNDNETPKNSADDKYRSVIPSSQETDDRNWGQLLLWNSDGEEITRNIYSMAEDQSGYIWLGTDVGVVVNYRPNSIFKDIKPVFTRVKIAREDGSSSADYLLEKEGVTAIAIDAGNRKWFGTQRSGVFLMSADGTKAIATYNTQNSPLPSNYISSLAINNATGEVIIGTDKGVVALRGSATEGMNNFSKIYAFPNPVRPEYSGVITITGLMTQSNVKITDVAGKLVYETTSVGGQALWDGSNLWGEKVKTGIYLVFVASQDGAESGVTKIAIVR